VGYSGFKPRSLHIIMH